MPITYTNLVAPQQKTHNAATLDALEMVRNHFMADIKPLCGLFTRCPRSIPSTTSDKNHPSRNPPHVHSKASRVPSAPTPIILSSCRRFPRAPAPCERGRTPGWKSIRLRDWSQVRPLIERGGTHEASGLLLKS